MPIEERMKLEMSYCVVIGDAQKCLTMFVTLRCEVRIIYTREFEGRREEGGREGSDDCVFSAS